MSPYERHPKTVAVEMNVILSHPLVRPLYAFLLECDETPLKKEILDCGAGGEKPPLALFYEHGYKTYGIDASSEQIELTQRFCAENNVELNIIKGDIRCIPFADNSLSFVYSVNTICHLTKKDTAVAVREMTRVLRPGGLCCVNFSSVNDIAFGDGVEVGKGEFLQEFDWYPGIIKEGHVCSYYEDDEPDEYFCQMKILRKEKRIIKVPVNIRKYPEGNGWQTADIWYICKKDKK